LEEQKAIARKLDKVSGLIEKRKTQLEKLSELVKSRFIELFGDSVINSMGWDTDTVIGVCDDIYGGGTPSKSHPEYYENGDIPWVSSKDMKTAVLYDSQIKINQLGVDNSTAKMVPVNSVIMVIRSGILKHTLPVAINAVPITVNQDLKVFIPSKRILSTFLMYQFKMLEKDILSGVRAVTADNIEFDSLKKREIIVPPIELQNQFASFVEQTDKSKFEIQKSLEKLETLKKALMQKYFG
jgi:type I restriction enzyme S subunit